MDASIPAAAILSTLTFREAVWLYPAAFVLHVLEERPRFTDWAKRYASPLFTQWGYDTIHIGGVILALAFAAIVSQFPNRSVVFAFYTFVFMPGLLFNTLFHAGATVKNRKYCPGVVTALAVYVPVFCFMTQLASREHLLDVRTFIVAVPIAGSFHIWEVGHNVFKAW